MAHKTTELKFNQWEDVDLWLCGICLWADSDLRLHLWVSDNNGDKRSSVVAVLRGALSRCAILMVPRRKSSRGASKPSTGKVTLLYEPNTFVIRQSFDTQRVERKARTQILKADTCRLIFLSLLRFIHFAFYCAFLGPSWKWVSLVLLNNSLCKSEPHNPFLLLVSLLKRRLRSLWANFLLCPRPVSWKWFNFCQRQLWNFDPIPTCIAVNLPQATPPLAVPWRAINYSNRLVVICRLSGHTHFQLRPLLFSCSRPSTSGFLMQYKD